MPPKHGLTGSYYLGHGGWQTDSPPPASEFNQVWSDPNDFMMPRIITAPAATRVDAQVAFGQGKGFHVSEKGTAVAWWPTGYAIPQGWGFKEKPWEANHFVAAIWKGYIHLPKAGTYYFATVSNGASAVYLNQARVALNGWGGGVLVADAFSYDSNQVHDFVTQNSTVKESYLADPRFQYAVPVPVDGPHDLPIEVDYDVAKSPSNWGNVALGIDLFWVTPDSARDANGKPVATIVPSDALYTETPGPIEKPVVRSANSTLSADFLYFDINTDHFVTVTVRLADKDGNPVAGRRVALATVGNQRDEIVQPEKPTNEQGETTGKIRANQTYAAPHDASIFAVDVTDLVDVGQVGHLTFQKTIEAGSFFPESFSPYYDPHAPEVTPMPLQVGRQVTVKMPLVNRNKFAADLDVVFAINASNIGASDWQEIGRVKNVRLQPGEHKDVSIEWTPDQATGHICFRVGVNATKVAAAAPATQALSATLLPVVFRPAGPTPKGFEPNAGSQQRNLGAVCPVWVEVYKFFDTGAIAGAGVYHWECEVGTNPPAEPEHGPGPHPRPPTPSRPAGPNDQDAIESWNRSRTIPVLTAVSSILPSELLNRSYLDVTTSVPRLLEMRTGRHSMQSNYRHLAVATSDTSSAYFAALRVSIQRYGTAQMAGDKEWIARHFTAGRLYEKRLANSLRREAVEQEREAVAMPADNPQDLQVQRTKLETNWSQIIVGNPNRSNARQKLITIGLTEAQAADLVQGVKPGPSWPTAPPQLKGPRAALLNLANINKASADWWQTSFDASVDTEAERPQHSSSSQTFTVGNPHGKQETVDLFLRSISIPPDWKLSIVNAEQDETGREASKSAEPKYPVHEIDPGKHYNLTLPANTQTQVASVVMPVGEVGARTTARWAVEGKIGDDLIGGMVHEMNVPYIIPDLQLPPVGSKEVEEELPIAGRAWSRLIAELVAGVIVLGLLLFFFIFLRRSRSDRAA